MPIPKYLPSIDMKRVGSAIGQAALWFIETGFKLLALVAGAIAMGSPGKFSDKLGNGFSSLPQGLRKLFDAPELLIGYGRAIRDYDTMTISNFEMMHDSGMIVGYMEYIRESVSYFDAVYSNAANQPVAAVTAGGIAFGTFWLLGRIIRFARQRGRGPVLVRFEQKLGRKLFDRPELVPKKATSVRSKPKSKPEPKTKPDQKQKKGSRPVFKKGNKAGKKLKETKTQKRDRKKEIADNLPANGEKTSKPPKDIVENAVSDSQQKESVDKHEIPVSESKDKKMEKQSKKPKKMDPKKKKNREKQTQKQETKQKQKQKNSKSNFDSLSQALDEARSS